MQRTLGEKIFNICNLLFFLLFSITLLIPVLYILRQSVDVGIVKGGVSLWPSEASSAYYRMVLLDKGVYGPLMNSIYITVVGTTLGVAVNAAAAYRFFLNGGESSQRLAAVSREAQIHCEEPALLSCFSGNCPNSRESFWSLDGDCLVCSAVKAACDGEGWILRLFNPTGEPQKDLLRTGDFAFPVSAAPWEVKTFRWRPGANHLEEDSLLEQPIE